MHERGEKNQRKEMKEEKKPCRTGQKEEQERESVVGVDWKMWTSLYSKERLKKQCVCVCGVISYAYLLFQVVGSYPLFPSLLNSIWAFPFLFSHTREGERERGWLHAMNQTFFYVQCFLDSKERKEYCKFCLSPQTTPFSGKKPNLTVPVPVEMFPVQQSSHFNLQ